MDSEEVLTISRYNSCTSLQESVSGSARSEEADVFDNDDDVSKTIFYLFLCLENYIFK